MGCKAFLRYRLGVDSDSLSHGGHVRGGKTSDFARSPHFVIVGPNEVLSVQTRRPLSLRTSHVDVAGPVYLANLASGVEQIPRHFIHIHPDSGSQATPRSFAAH